MERTMQERRQWRRRQRRHDRVQRQQWAVDLETRAENPHWTGYAPRDAGGAITLDQVNEAFRQVWQPVVQQELNRGNVLYDWLTTTTPNNRTWTIDTTGADYTQDGGTSFKFWRNQYVTKEMDYPQVDEGQ